MANDRGEDTGGAHRGSDEELGDEHPQRQAARENNKEERNRKQGQRGDWQRRLRSRPAWMLLRSDECGHEVHDPIWLKGIKGWGGGVGEYHFLRPSFFGPTLFRKA